MFHTQSDVVFIKGLKVDVVIGVFFNYLKEFKFFIKI